MISSSSVSKTSPLLLPTTVLVVDDDQTNLLLTARVLEKYGFVTMMANGPKRAIELFGQFGEQIDMLVTDVSMPEMNGYDLAAFLRIQRPQLPVLCMSAAMDKEARRQMFSSVRKPFTRIGLIESVLRPYVAVRRLP